MIDFIIKYEDGTTLVLHPAFFPSPVVPLRKVLKAVDKLGQAEDFEQWALDTISELKDVHKAAAAAAEAEAARMGKEATAHEVQAAVAKEARDKYAAQLKKKGLKNVTKEEHDELDRLHANHAHPKDLVKQDRGVAASYVQKKVGELRIIKALETNKDEVETWQRLPKRRS